MDKVKNKCPSTGKVIFKTAGEAKKRLISLKSHNNHKKASCKKEKKPSVTRIYKCNFCKGFHLTSIDESFKRKKPSDAYINKMKFLNSIDIEKWKEDSIPFEQGHTPPPKTKKK